MAILWQCVLFGYTYSLAGNAADEAARAATAANAVTGGDGGACQAAGSEHLPGRLGRAPRSAAAPTGRS